jgi:hypothetical protein
LNYRAEMFKVVWQVLDNGRKTKGRCLHIRDIKIKVYMAR